MSEYTMIQLPTSLAPLSDEELDWFLSDMKARPTAWPVKCIVVLELGAQLMYERDRRLNNQDESNVHKEPRLLEFSLEKLDPKQSIYSLHVFNTRSKDNAIGMPMAIGELVDLLVDLLIGHVGVLLAAAYPDP